MSIITTNLSIAELRKKLGKTVIVYVDHDKIIMRSRPNYNSGKYKNMCNRNRKLLREVQIWQG